METTENNSYKLLCSEKTLQTNPKGFFLQFANHLCDLAGEKNIKHFGTLTENSTRLKTLYELKEVKDDLNNFLSNVQEIYRKKCEASAGTRLNEAVTCFQNKNASKAIVLFSQSLLKAEYEGPVYTEALFGRIKTLSELGKFELALEDILALLKTKKLPKSLANQGEIYLEMSLCYKGLNEAKKSSVALGIATKLLGEQKVQSFLDKTKTDCTKVQKYRPKLPKVQGPKHDFFKNASADLKIIESKNQGRFVVAKNDIKTGQTLIVEEPFAACLLPDFFGTHCHNCFTRLEAAFPCQICTSVAFCSPKCQSEATLSYHRYECKFLDLLIGSGASILCHIALRLITQKTLEQNLELYKNKEKEHIFSLCTNEKLRPGRDFFQRSIMATLLLRILQKSNYFPSQNILSNDQDELKIAEMLLYFLQMLQFNAHEIYEICHPKEHRFKNAKTVYIGVGIYPTVALFNHDCYPAVTRYFVGKNIVINTIRPLRQNEVVAENYGPIFTKKNFHERQRSLFGRYWFKCNCLACVQNWPLLNPKNNLQSKEEQVRCITKNCEQFFTLPVKNITLKCPKCNNKINLEPHLKNLEWCKEQYYLAFDKMNSLQVDESIKIMTKALDEFHTISKAPHSLTHLAEETLKACYADFGNRNCI